MAEKTFAVQTAEETRTAISKNLVSLRTANHLTQAELAEKLGVSTVTVHNWECGRNLPKAKRLNDVAIALQTTATELLQEAS